MSIINALVNNIKNYNYITKRRCSNAVPQNAKFETVFSLPSIKYIAMINRLKVYHLLGSSVAIPSCGLLEIMNVLPGHTCSSAAYVGVTAAAVMSLISLPFRNIIGFLYISDDNKFIKISSVDFWGRRKDRIVTIDEWIPILELPSKVSDPVFISPQLTDGTKYRLLIRFAKILDAKRIGHVLE